jgi:hypothetical protein
MNAAIVRAERHATVRRCARGWKRERLIDDVTLATIERAYPDDRRRLGPVFRSLAFLFTVFAIVAAFAFVMLVARPRDAAAAVLALIVGAVLWLATEGLKGPLRLADAGIESATALAGAVFMAGGTAYMIGEVLRVSDPAGARLLALSVVVLFGLTTLRWGSTAGAVASTLWLGLLLGQFPQTRASWSVAALVLAPLALRGSESARLAPSHRRACGAVLLMALAGLYVALHIGSWDGQILEQGRSWLFRAGRSAALPLPRALFKLTTALVPLALLAYAIATRRRLLLAVGLALGVASLITLRFYVHIADLWVVLSAAGSGLIVLALALRRWLDGGAGHERAGWTTRRLSGETALMRAAEIAVTVVAATPKPAGPEAPHFEGSGGRSGGGGASGEF